MVKCARCGNPIVDVVYKTYKRKRYHQSCYAEMVKEAENKEQKRRSDSFQVDYTELESLIKSLFNLDELPVNILKQIDEFVSKYNYTYRGIINALKYFYDVQGNKVIEDMVTIGIVPYVYLEAEAHYKRIESANKENTKRDISERTNTVRIIPPKRAMNMINIEDL